MSHILADNIISPLGNTSELNYQAVKRGESRLTRYDSRWNLKEPFVGSLFDDSEWASLKIDGLTRFESLAVRSIRAALAQTDINPASPRVALIISTTKGNVELLAATDSDSAAEGASPAVDTREYPGEAAMVIAREVGVTTTPIVVCNACISGVAALLLAHRMIHAGEVDHAIVCGIDVQSEFIVSGFQSFKAISTDQCKPFDANRTGLNLGEAAATIILGREGSGWEITAGAVHNDANHISAPSRTAEGSLRSLLAVTAPDDNLALVNVHGTATSYNDQMESIAIERAGLSDIPLNSFKGFYGHTMGAAGVLESILSMRAVDDSTIVGVRGFEEIGVPGKINISNRNRTTDLSTFVKLLSGFGGCNGALRFARDEHKEPSAITPYPTLATTHRVRITPQGAEVDDGALPTTSTGKSLLSELYRAYVKDYPKFFKMDTFTRLAFVASELLLQAERDDATTRQEEAMPREDRPVILFNKVSSLYADAQHQHSINDPDNYFPSPSIFVYTLPNITTGEIAIRNKYMSETSFYVLPRRDDAIIDRITSLSVIPGKTTSVISGWVDCVDDNDFIAELTLKEIITKD